MERNDCANACWQNPRYLFGYLRPISTLFLKNLLDPDENSKILNDEHLTKKTIKTLLNKIFSTNKKENGRKVTDLAEEYNTLKNWVAGKGQ